MGSNASGPAECDDDVPGDPARGNHAQNKRLIAREQDAVARAAWRAQMATRGPHTLVVLDETSTPTTLWGRAKRGERVVGPVPRRCWEAVTLLATVTAAGLGPGLHLPGAAERDAFDTFVVKALPACTLGRR